MTLSYNRAILYIEAEGSKKNMVNLKTQIRMQEKALSGNRALLRRCKDAGLKQINVKKVEIGMVIYSARTVITFPDGASRARVKGIHKTRTSTSNGFVTLGGLYFKTVPVGGGKQITCSFSNDREHYVWVKA